MVYIDQVHYITDSHGCRVVGNVKWTNTLSELAASECTKQQMIKFISEHPNVTKTKYKRNGYWVAGEDVRVVRNQNGSYLRTDANSKSEDNLGGIIEY